LKNLGEILIGVSFYNSPKSIFKIINRFY